jgi:hypothetical protein
MYSVLFQMTCKICGCCGTNKPQSEYHFRNKKKKTLNSWCKDCKNKARIERRKHTPDCPIKAKQYYLKQWYGLTVDQYDSMVKQQNNSCAICDIVFDSGIKGTKPHVDHCHVTGRVRGLLCSKCNTLLGMANDNKVVLENAITYLDRSQDDTRS